MCAFMTVDWRADVKRAGVCEAIRHDAVCRWTRHALGLFTSSLLDQSRDFLRAESR